jgi:hypothetical protein
MTAPVCPVYSCALILIIIFQHPVADTDSRIFNSFNFTAVHSLHFYVDCIKRLAVPPRTMEAPGGEEV